MESTNPIFGLTVNPHDTTQTAGGSSGGEAALIAGGGSILGFGTDVGGSVRIPSAMCGIYCLKPVDLRLSYVHLSSDAHLARKSDIKLENVLSMWH